MTLLLLILIAFAVYYLFGSSEGFESSACKSRKKACPNCESSIEDAYNVCPVCKVTLKKKCSGCGERLDYSWNYCPYCEKPLEKSWDHEK